MARSTIAKVVKDHGLKPSPDRPMSRATFDRAHGHLMAAAELFIAEVWTVRGLLRYYLRRAA